MSGAAQRAATRDAEAGAATGPAPPVRRRARNAAGAAARIAAPALAGVMERLDRKTPGRLSVLMYHRIGRHGPEDLLDPALLSATPEGFADQIAYLSAHRPLISAETLCAVRRGEADLPPGAVMITFDDGYDDFARHAWPVLHACAAPVTLFVPTAFPGHEVEGFWWDRLHAAFQRTDRRDRLSSPVGEIALSSREERAAAFVALRERLKTMPHDEAMAAVESTVNDLGGAPDVHRVLDWEALRRLAAEGVTLAPHSRTHPLMNRLPVDRAIDEARGSWTDLERQVGPTPKIIAFPAGGYDQRLVAALDEEGFELGFTTTRGSIQTATANWLELPRRNVGARSNVAVLRLQLVDRPRRSAA